MDFDSQAKILEQRRNRYLQQQDVNAPDGQMVGRHYVAANPLEYLAAGLRSYGGMRGEQLATQELGDLQKQKQEAMQGDMNAMITALRGKPAETVQPLTPNDDEGNVNAPIQMPAKAGSMDDFYRVAAGSQFPQFQQMGMQGALAAAQEQAKAMQPKPVKWEKIELPTQDGGRRVGFVNTNADDPISTFKEGGTENAAMSVGPAGQAYNPRTLQQGQVLADPNKPFTIGAGGAVVPNTAYQTYETTKAAKSAPQVNVTNRIENKAAENIAGQVGPLLKESATAAEGAVRTLDAASRIVGAIDKGNVIAGPLANTRVTVRQAAELLGVGGKDNAEVLANTRSTVRGLAEMTLQGRKQMSGQGAITESESKLAEKAMSGDISDLTPAEIKQLAQASARAAQWTIQTHKTRSDAASKLPGMGGLMPFFNTPAMPGNMPEGFKVIE